MPYRLLFLDLDGTLVGRHDTVSPRNLSALNAASETGCEIVICTARNRYMVEQVAAQWHGHGYGIFTNGSVIAEWETGKVLHKVTIPRPQVDAATRAARECGLSMLLFGAHVEEDSGRWVYTEHEGSLHAEWKARCVHRLRIVDDLLADASIQPVSMGVYGTREPVERMAQLWHATLADVDIFSTDDPKFDGWCCYANSTVANKATAAQYVAERLGVPREEVMAIGDHVNDVDMLRWAGLGVAMGDGHPDAKAAADTVTSTQEEDGVAEAIERFVLCCV